MAGRRGAARSPLDEAGLMEYALRSLSSKMRSERDLRRKMMERAETGEAGVAAVDAILQKLKDLRYLSDERFAADYTRLRKENERFGRRRVAQGLMQQGVPQELASTALEAAYAEVDEVALAKEYVARKRMKKPEDEKATARAVRRLLGAGFSSQTVWKVLRQWGAEVQEVDVDEPHDGESEEGA